MFHMRANIVAMGVIGAALLLPELAQAEQTGHASWYALHSRTASGEMMNPSAMTAAHRSLPFGTKVVVENLNNGKAVVVRINDRGPFIKGRIIDVSKAAASVLGMLGSGTARVKVSTSGGSSLKVAAKEESPVKVATATTKMESASGDKSAKVEDAPVKSAKMEGAHASKPVKVAAKSSKPTKVASASRGKSTKTAKASSKAAKIVTASAGKRSGKSETRVAGLMKSSRDIKRVACSCRLAQDLCRGFAQRFAQGGCGRFQGARQEPPWPSQGRCRPGLVRQPLWRLRAQRELHQLALQSHGRPEGRPSPHAQTPGQGPAFDFRSKRLAG